VATTNNILLGTSGWSYKEWIGPFYTKQDKSFLKAYTSVFNTVEIDSTFYRYPSKGTAMGWARYSPEGFVFTAKLPKLITHEKKLGIVSDVEKDLNTFVDLMEPLWLGGKLGCLLIQLPPSFDYKPKELESFFKILPSQIKFAVEFRNLSWMREETWFLLEKYNVAYAIVDEPLLPPEVHITSDIAYFRWHGKGEQPWFDYRYKTEELEPWIPKLKNTSEKAKKIYGYFNNHFHGYAVENCLQILQMLGQMTPQQDYSLQKVQSHFETLGKTMEMKLDAFKEMDTQTPEKLLLAFTDAKRLSRAKEIRDDELQITKQTSKIIEATLRDYKVLIDLEDRMLRHNCEDWAKGLASKRICKHISKVILSINRNTALDLLRDLQQNKNEWKFELIPNTSDKS
jgi:uncharacterized protein YecE (DUF72 family)